MAMAPFIKPRWRRGLSLLEVTISIGVITIGLLGIMAVLPLAGRRAVEGVVADGKAMHGRAWVEEFHIRAYTDPSSFWIFANNASAWNPTNPQTMMIDPQHVAYRGENSPPGPQPFPFVFIDRDGDSTNDVLNMPRITLRSGPNRTQLSSLAASVIFSSRNDLQFRKPDDPTNPPVQEVFDDASIATDASNPAAYVPNKRMAEGRFSWMAMVTPTSTDGREWRLAVIVYHDRDPSMDLSGTPPDDDSDKTLANERVVPPGQVVFSSGGLSGGAVTISSTDKGAVKVRRGNWVMLSASSTSATSGPTVRHQWYRVSDAEQGLTTTTVSGVTTYSRELMLDGPDWPVSTLGGVTQMTVVKGVVGVYEKTFRIEQSSLWH